MSGLSRRPCGTRGSQVLAGMRSLHGGVSSVVMVRLVLILLVHKVLRTRKEERIRSLAVWSEQDMATRTLQWLQDTVVSLALFSFRQAWILLFRRERQPAVTPATFLELVTSQLVADNFKCSSCDAWSLPLAALHCWTERVTYQVDMPGAGLVCQDGYQGPCRSFW